MLTHGILLESRRGTHVHAAGKGFKSQSERSIGSASSSREGDGGEIVTYGYGLQKEVGSASKVGA